MKQKRKYWKRGEVVRNVAYYGDEIWIQCMQIGRPEGRVIFVGDGHSLSIVPLGPNSTAFTAVSVEPFHPKIQKDIFNEEDTVYAFYLRFDCSGLKEAGLELSDYINNWFETNREIWIVGHSKDGVCVAEMARSLNPSLNVTLLTISAPYEGTITAGVGFRKMKKKFNILLNVVHKLVYSGHNVDHDIEPGSDFLKGIPAEEEICKNFRHINVATTLNEVRFSECHGLEAKFCWFIEYCTQQKSDGIATLSSQLRNNSNLVNNFLFSEKVMFCAHPSSLEMGIELFMDDGLIDLEQF